MQFRVSVEHDSLEEILVLPNHGCKNLPLIVDFLEDCKDCLGCPNLAVGCKLLHPGMESHDDIFNSLFSCRCLPIYFLVSGNLYACTV